MIMNVSVSDEDYLREVFKVFWYIGMLYSRASLNHGDGFKI